MANNDVLKSKQLIEEFSKVWDEHSKFISKANTSLESFVNNAKIPSNYTKGLTDIKNTQDALAQSYEKVAKSSAKVTQSAKQEEQARLRELRLATKREKKFDQMDAKMKRAERQAQRNAAAEAKLASAYNQLNAKLNQAEKEYKDLAASQGLNSKATQKSQREVLKLRKQLDGINQPIKRWNNNVGNYASGLKNLAGALGWAGLTYAILNGVKAAYETIKVYDSLNKSLVKVTGSQEAATTQFAIVQDMAERYGLALQSTTEDYLSFLAATKGTNLEGSKATKIFDSVAKSAAALGLSSDTTKGALLALTQMISKGKVTAEELRGQLGERIPGAMNIMARALGVTTAELDDMMKKGELIADEVLPKFAVELEKTFGVDQVDRIETLTGAQNRLGNAWDNFILGLEGGDGVISKTFTALLNYISGAINAITRLNMSADEKNKKTQSSGQKVGSEQAMSNIEDIQNINGITPERAFHKVRLLADESIIKVNELKKEQAELKEITENFFKYRPKGGYAGELEDLRSKLKTTTLELGKASGAYSVYSNFIKKTNEVKLEESKITDETIKSKREKIKEENIEIQQAKTGKEWLEAKIKLLTEQRDKNLQTSASYKALNEVIEQYNKILNLSIEVDNEAMSNLDDKLKNQKALEEQIKELNKATKEYIETFSGGFLDDAGLGSANIFLKIEENGKTMFDNLFNRADGLKEKFAVAFGAISEVGQEAFNLINSNSQANFEAEYSRLEQQKEISLQFAGDSTAAKENIEAQYEKKRKEIARRQAEAEKKKALFNIAIDTAQGIVSALASTPPNIPLSIAIGVIGATQLAAVSSKQVPQFWQGGVVGGSQQIVVNDDPYGVKGSNYKEVIQKPNGQISKPQGKNVKMTVPKGTIVHPTYDAFEQSLNDVLNDNSIAPFHNMRNSNVMNVVNTGITKAELKEVFSSEISRLNNTIANKPTSNLQVDENGFKTFVNNGSKRKEILNARHSGKGFFV